MLNPKKGNPYTYETAKFNNQYLDEIGEHHADNFQHILNTRVKAHRLATRVEAREFLFACILTALRDLGVDVQPWMDEIDLKALSRAKGIQVEIRNKPAMFENFDMQRDFRRLGIYINKHNEIAHFISVPHEIKETRTAGGLVVVQGDNSYPWVVWTTIMPGQKSIVIHPN